MATLHKATMAPTKLELVTAWLEHQPWAKDLGELEMIGSYRFDDPEGEVGVEALLLTDGDEVVHLPLTYRGAPLPGGEPFLLGTSEHSVLGTRYVYDAIADPVAVAAYVTAVLTGGEQAPVVVEKDGEVVEERIPMVFAKGSGAWAPVEVPPITAVSVVSRDADAVVRAGAFEVTVRRLLGDTTVGSPDTLLVSWLEGQAVVAGVEKLPA